jgi:hypothetical protein
MTGRTAASSPGYWREAGVEAANVLPISFTNSQLDQVFAGAEPLHARDHAAYLQTVADLLQGVSEPGDGQVYRAARAAQMLRSPSR